MHYPILASIGSVFGLGEKAEHLTIAQTSVRAVIVFVATLVMVRLADKRFLAKKTAFDALLGLVIGSSMARAINGSEQLGPTIVSGFLLVGMHRALATAARRYPMLGELIKGRSDVVIENGQIVRDKLANNALDESDLLEELRLNGQVETADKVLRARVERNGELSVILRDQ